MAEPKVVELESGAKLKITPAPFEEAKALYQATLEEMKAIKVTGKDERFSFFKDLFCQGFSSKKIEAALWVCFKWCQYCDGRGELKIDKDTFGPIEARRDYIQVCMEVMRENIDPFGKGLYAQFMAIMREMPVDLE